MNAAEKDSLIRDIAKRTLTAKQLSRRYDLSVDSLRAFADHNKQSIEVMHDRLIAEEDRKRIATQKRLARLVALEGLTDPEDEEDRKSISQLWVSSKYERLKRYQFVLERMLIDFSLDAMIIREIRSYMNDVAEELGQLPNRGSADNADDANVHYSIEGVDLDRLR